ncbi:MULTISPECIES: extracellular solute-binding protein [unclassified Aureimonas]|uniref:extracellular solute-binding protein n=1 Tax=unclassified Aureimonas TaxID=2615206 RepID=UPI0006F62B13|nr:MULTISPECIES: extracellular solute-binding protein [unclassified Aureimonas]KQT61879.1 iron ABC transporter substrate-binding protein [Aureimonas sp. Leaf460]KQT61911.1 iron ABC transporter substrate-binding protein [Aureimonas sp. Leaf427]
MWTKTMAAAMMAAGAMTAPVLAEAPAPYQVTPELEAAAKAEGKVVFYTATDVTVAEKLADLFKQKYPGIAVQVERAGSERVFQRIGQEYSSGIYSADVIETSDAVHFEYFKREGWLEPMVPEEVAAKWPADEKDPDGAFAAYRAHLSVLAYRTDLLPEAEAPKTWTDLLDPRFKGKMVKAHPGYSGTIMTATYVLSQLLGWEYFEKLGTQEVMQVQSSTEPPKKLGQGERALEVDGNEYNIFRLQDEGQPIKIVYPAEGTPLAVGNAAVLKEAPNKNAAKLFYSFLFSKDAQQLNSDFGGLRSFHPDVKEKTGRTPLSEIKLLHSDPVALEPEIETIKANYEQYFGT